MPDLNVEILGRSFKVHCGDHEVKATKAAADLYAQNVEKFSRMTQEAGMSQLLLLGGISLADSILNDSLTEVSSGNGAAAQEGEDDQSAAFAIDPDTLDRLGRLVEQAEELADSLQKEGAGDEAKPD